MKYIFFYLLLILPISSYSQYSLLGSNGFVENIGQVSNEQGELCNDVKFIYAHQGLKIILRENSFSYEIYSVENNSNLSEAGTDNPFPTIPIQSTVQINRIDIKFSGSNSYPKIIKEDTLPGYTNFLNIKKHVKHARSFGKVIYKGIYPNIDLVFYIQDQKPKYDFVLNPGADLKDIKMLYNGEEDITITEGGEIRMNTSLGTILETIPCSYQREDDKQVKVKYELNNSVISFKTKTYDKKKTLVIDPIPVLVWGKTFTGSNNLYNSVAIDSKDNPVILGSTGSTINIATTGAYQTTIAGESDIFLVRFDQRGNVRWGTYFGGNGHETGNDISFDSDYNILITGNSTSISNIATPGAFQEIFGGQTDSFIAKFDSAGALLWSTYYGGAEYDYSSGICVDQADNIMFTGETNSPNNIASPGCYQPANNDLVVFVAKFNPNGIREWGTYYGGNGTRKGGISTDSQDNIIFTGTTLSNSLIASAGSHQASIAGSSDAFVVKLNSAGFRIWGTYYGGSGGENNYGLGPYGVAVDNQDNILITGTTRSSNNIATPGSFKSTSVENDAFLAKFNTNGLLIWGTYYGGNGFDIGHKIAIDHFDNIILTGGTGSSDNIATSCAYQTIYSGTISNNLGSPFIVKFSSGGSRIWATYYKGGDFSQGMGIAVDSKNNIFASGYISNSDTYLAKFREVTPVIPSITANGPVTFCPGDSVTLSVSSGVNYLWNSGDTTQAISIKEEGNYYATVTDTNGCPIKSPSINVTFIRPTVSVSGSAQFCSGDNVTLTASKGNSYLWSNGDNAQSIFVTDGGSYTVTTEDTNGCVSTSLPFMVTEVFPPFVSLGRDTILCSGKEKTINLNIPNATFLWSDGSTNSNFTITSTGTYSVEVTLAPCPSVNKSILIKYISEIEYTVPNLITPNEDRKNDYFEINNMLPGTSVSIYNSWGTLVYKSDDYHNEWGAYYVNAGIYYYHISNKNTCVKEYHGWLHVVK